MPWLPWITALHCAGRRHDERRRVGVWAVTEALLRDSPAGLDVKRTWSLIRIVIVGGGLPVRSFFVGPGCSITFDMKRSSILSPKNRDQKFKKAKQMKS